MSESQCCILERVARAMWFYHVDLQGYPNGCPTWDEMLLMPSEQGVVEEVRSNAKAAIRAMLEGMEPVAWRYDREGQYGRFSSSRSEDMAMAGQKPRSTISAR